MTSREEIVEERHLRSQCLCGHGAIIVHTKSAGTVHVLPARCKTWGCPHCSGKLVDSWVSRIAAARPQRLLTLTADPGRVKTAARAYAAMAAAFPKLVKYLRSRGYKVEYCAVWELHKSGFPHLHVLQRGGYLPQEVIKKWWSENGPGSIVDIRPIEDGPRAALYVAKYLTAGCDVKALRALGVRRLFWTGRGFFPPLADVLPRCEPAIGVSCEFVAESTADVFRRLRSAQVVWRTRRLAAGGVEVYLRPGCNTDELLDRLERHRPERGVERRRRRRSASLDSSTGTSRR